MTKDKDIGDRLEFSCDDINSGLIYRFYQPTIESMSFYLNTLKDISWDLDKTNDEYQKRQMTSEFNSIKVRTLIEAINQCHNIKELVIVVDSIDRFNEQYLAQIIQDITTVKKIDIKFGTLCESNKIVEAIDQNHHILEFTLSPPSILSNPYIRVNNMRIIEKSLDRNRKEIYKLYDKLMINANNNKYYLSDADISLINTVDKDTIYVIFSKRFRQHTLGIPEDQLKNSTALFDKIMFMIDNEIEKSKQAESTAWKNAKEELENNKSMVSKIMKEEFFKDNFNASWKR